MTANTMARLKVTNIFELIKANKKLIPPIPDSIWQNPLHFIAFGFGSGAIPFAPGTFGTLMAIPFYLSLRSLPALFYIFFVLLLIAVSSWICDRVSKEIKVHDHPGMCLDEIVGFLVTTCYAPHHWLWIVIGFLLFRLFDIWKPWPIRMLDQTIQGGFGIVLDDVIAGVYGLIVMQLIMLIPL